MLATACLSAVRRASLVFALNCGNGTIRHNKIKRVNKIRLLIQVRSYISQPTNTLSIHFLYVYIQ